MTAQALEQSVLESKDKAQLIAIAEALGVKASTRNKKSEIIDQILQMTGAPRPSDAAPAPVANNGDSSVRIFSRTASGDVAPVRVIKGSRTQISGPMALLCWTHG